jgi:hypothetical protein
LAPPAYSSPGTPIGAGPIRASSTYSCVESTGAPIGGRADHASGSPSTAWAEMTCVSLGPYWFSSAAAGLARKKARSCGVERSASPAVITCRSEGSLVSAISAVSARFCSAAKGRKRRWTSNLRRYDSSASPSRRVSSSTSTSVPPAAQVEKISWNDTSNDSEANCSVRAAASPAQRSTCQRRRLASARCGSAAPFGFPVDPEV